MPACLELGDLVVHPVEARRIELDTAFLGLNPRPARPIDVLVQPHGVDAVLGIECRPLVGQRLLRRTRTVAQVDAPKLDRLAVVVELVLLARDPAVPARRLREPVLHPNLARLGRVPRRECIPGGQVRGIGAQANDRQQGQYAANSKPNRKPHFRLLLPISRKSPDDGK